MKYFPYVIFGLFLLDCSGDGRRKEKAADQLIVAAAANVQFVMKELEAAFEKQSGMQIEVLFSSSGKLTAQIQQGAPYDLLLSADMKYPQWLHENGYAPGPPKVYATGYLALWTLKGYELGDGTDILSDPRIRCIAVAHPGNAPYGAAAIKFLEQAGLREQLDDKLVYGESIAQTNQYIISGACDIGFTAKSVLLSPEMRDIGDWVELPDTTYDAIRQGIVITRYGQEKHPIASRAFYEYIFSESAKTIFNRYGYRTEVEQ